MTAPGITTLSDFQTDILALLDDPDQSRYTDASINEGLRWALLQYVQAYPSNEYAIKDLDGAGNTTLAPEDQKNVQVGAAGYCMLIRTISRAETINLNQEAVADLRATADKYITEFKKVLGLFSITYDEQLALETARAANATTAAAALVAATTARDTALAGYQTARDAALDVDNVAAASALVAATTARDTALANYALARDAALDADNVAAASAKAAADLALQAAKTAADLNAQDARINAKELRTMAVSFKLAFDLGLAQAARRRPPVSNPSTAAWNDDYHSWNV